MREKFRRIFRKQRLKVNSCVIGHNGIYVIQGDDSAFLAAGVALTCCTFHTHYTQFSFVTVPVQNFKCNLVPSVGDFRFVCLSVSLTEKSRYY